VLGRCGRPVIDGVGCGLFHWGGASQWQILYSIRKVFKGASSRENFQILDCSPSGYTELMGVKHTAKILPGSLTIRSLREQVFILTE